MPELDDARRQRAVLAGRQLTRDREPGVAVTARSELGVAPLDGGGGYVLVRRIVEPVKPADGSFVDDGYWWPWTAGGRLLAGLAIGDPRVLTRLYA